MSQLLVDVMANVTADMVFLLLMIAAREGLSWRKRRAKSGESLHGDPKETGR
jgi:hypothetical protein